MATEYNIPDAYSQYLNKIQNELLSKTQLIEYAPQSASTLKSAIAKALRPSYDKAIANRNKTAATNRAAIDADAAARGVGASTWVTDAKNRQNDAAATDIANLESDYASSLYQNLLARMSEQEANRLNVEQINANARNNALAQALSNTNTWWEKFKEMQDAANAPAYSGGSSTKKKGSTSYSLDAADFGLQEAIANGEPDTKQYVYGGNSLQKDIASAGGLYIKNGHIYRKDTNKKLFG